MIRWTFVATPLFLVACSDVAEEHPGAAVRESIPTVQLVSTVDVDFSKAVVAVDEETACIILRYSPRVQCIRRSGATVAAFGARGEGPGEFGEPEQLIRGSDGRIAVIDVGRGRLSVWRPDGTFIGSVPVPPLFKPVAPFGETVLGAYEQLPDGQQFGRELHDPSARLAEVEIRSGEIRRTLEIPGPTDYVSETECSGSVAQQGSMNSQGAIVFGLCSRELMFWHPSGDIRILRQPYSPETLSARDIQEFKEEYRRGLEGIMPPAMIDQLLQSVASPESTVPYGWSRTRLHDGWDRLWVAIVRDRINVSYFHVYTDTRFAGTVQIRDRLKAFDIVGSTLVALVEREPTEGWGGIWRQALDWYDLSPPVEMTSRQ